MSTQDGESSSMAAIHPFKHTTSKIIVIPNTIDVEEESRLYDEMCDEQDIREVRSHLAPRCSPGPPSIFSRDIWLGDNSGESTAFTQDVKISGWTNVGDKRGAYIVYDCVITTKEGPVIHVHKRYNAFDELHYNLRHTLPHHQKHFVPPLPPKSPLAKFRPAFLDQRRRLLQYWLSAVLLHPEIGSCQAVRQWIMN